MCGGHYDFTYDLPTIILKSKFHLFFTI
ncbi:hypothetical protein ABIC49_000937 [Burkholderia ambifaria]